MNKKVLITGGNGFIGKNLKEWLVSKYDVSSPDRSELNLLNQEEVESYLLGHNFDVVIYAANQNCTKREETTEYEILHNNLKMFCNVERCNKFFDKMYYFGSGAEYDMRYYTPLMKEEYFGKYIPEDAYGLSKYLIHRLSRRSPNIYNLILFGVYGKYEEWHRRFISNAICRNLFNMPIQIEKNAHLDYLYIDDLCKIVEWFVDHNPKYPCYNICRGEKIDLKTLAKMVNMVSDSISEIYVSKTGFRAEYSGDNTRMLEEMGDSQINFTDYLQSIGALMTFYKEHKDEINTGRL